MASIGKTVNAVDSSWILYSAESDDCHLCFVNLLTTYPHFKLPQWKVYCLQLQQTRFPKFCSAFLNADRVHFLLESAAVQYRSWLGAHCDCSRSQCSYSHIEDGTLLLLGHRAWGQVCCSFLLLQGCKNGLRGICITITSKFLFFPSS